MSKRRPYINLNSTIIDAYTSIVTVVYVDVAV